MTATQIPPVEAHTRLRHIAEDLGADRFFIASRDVTDARSARAAFSAHLIWDATETDTPVMLRSVFAQNHTREHAVEELCRRLPQLLIDLLGDNTRTVRFHSSDRVAKLTQVQERVAVDLTLRPRLETCSIYDGQKVANWPRK